MFSFSISTEIDAAPARVWRALCNPAEVVVWDSGVEEAIDAPDDYPQPGQHVRCRYSNGPFRVLHDRPQEVEAERRLRSLLAVGPFRFDEVYTLQPREWRCRLTAEMDVTVPVPLVGSAFARGFLGPATQRTVEASLQAIKRYCETP